MTITSTNFFIVVFLTSIIFYFIPHKIQWGYLLVISIIMYCMLGVPITLLYVIGSTAVVYIAALSLKRTKYDILITWGALIVIFGLLALMKYVDFLVYNVNRMASLWGGGLEAGNIVAALGVSYYTLSLASYLLDVKWEVVVPEKNFFKVLLFACFFPKMVMGPICKWEEFSHNLEEKHSFSMTKYADASIRVLYGVFMKIVVAGRVATIPKVIFENTASMNGLFLIGGVLIYTFQLYCDFAGGMHIILGVSSLFGIQLPENFNNPFFSKSVQEWWQRWHITLGRWTKEYIFYPVLRSNALMHIRNGLQKYWGKKVAKKMSTYIGMLFVWLYIGVWHGGAWRFLAMGVYFWIIICIENEKLGHHKRFINICGTLIAVSLGNLAFICNSLTECLQVVYYMIKNFFSYFNTSVSLFKNMEGITILNSALLLWGISIVVFAECIEWKRNINIVLWLRQKKTFIRWAIIYIILFITVIWGAYGEEYEAAKFIYQEF